MKNKFKKAIASVMAITTLVVGVTGMNASAYHAEGPCDNGYTTSSAASTALYATTERYLSGATIVVDIYEHDGSVTTDTKGTISYNSNKKFHQILGSNFSYEKSKHRVGTGAWKYYTIWV